MEKVKCLKELILSYLKKDYVNAKENNMHYLFEAYENMITKAENMKISQFEDSSIAETISELYIKDINIYLNKQIGTNYKYSQNRISFLEIQIDTIEKC